MAKHVLITGFEPFGGAKLNPSEMVARALEGRRIAGRLVVTRILSVETQGLRDRLQSVLQETDPEVVVSLGQAAGRTAIALERVAINVLDFEQPDNAGIMHTKTPIFRNGPDARIATLPFEQIVERWRADGIPGYVSNSAGAYICNQSFYELLGFSEASLQPFAAAFVHLPYLPEQAAAAGAESTPSMSLELMIRAVEAMLEVLVAWAPSRGATAIPPTILKKVSL